MSISYEIGIMAGKNAAKAIDAFFESEDVKKNWSKYERKEVSTDTVMYRTWCNNHPSFYNIGKKFLEVIKGFKESKYEPDALKCIMISENGNKDEYSNAPGQLFFEDFDVINSTINYPEELNYEADADLQYICYTADECEYDVSADVMAKILMDDKVSTREMFESLADAYRYGSEEFRSGLDRAVSILTGYRLAEIAGLIEKEGKSLGD